MQAKWHNGAQSSASGKDRNLSHQMLLKFQCLMSGGQWLELLWSAGRWPACCMLVRPCQPNEIQLGCSVYFMGGLALPVDFEPSPLPKMQQFFEVTLQGKTMLIFYSYLRAARLCLEYGNILTDFKPHSLKKTRHSNVRHIISMLVSAWGW